MSINKSRCIHELNPPNIIYGHKYDRFTFILHWITLCSTTATITLIRDCWDLVPKTPFKHTLTKPSYISQIASWTLCTCQTPFGWLEYASDCTLSTDMTPNLLIAQMHFLAILTLIRTSPNITAVCPRAPPMLRISFPDMFPARSYAQLTYPPRTRH